MAHRGFWNCEEAGYSENSLASLKAAQTNKLWGSECDIHLTADKKILVNHDRTISGLPIKKNSFETLSAILLKNGETRPSFEEYAQQTKKSKTRLVIEFKKQGSDSLEDEMVCKTIQILKDNNLFNPKRVAFISFSMYVCQKIAVEAKGFTNQHLEGDLRPSDLNAMGINGIDYHYSVFVKHPEWVEEAHSLGMSVNVWTVNKKSDMEQAIKWGVDAITTNEPLLLRELLGKKELR